MKRRAQLWELEDTLAELAFLARSADAEVVGQVTQRANRLTSTYVGSGKVDPWGTLAQMYRLVWR